jgi:hypothetical protein
MFSRKTECPISRDQFVANAKSVEVTINGQPTLAMVKEFSTGSFGWHHGDKLTIKVGDQLVKVQVGLTSPSSAPRTPPRTLPRVFPPPRNSSCPCPASGSMGRRRGIRGRRGCVCVRGAGLRARAMHRVRSATSGAEGCCYALADRRPVPGSIPGGAASLCCETVAGDAARLRSAWAWGAAGRSRCGLRPGALTPWAVWRYPSGLVRRLEHGTAKTSAEFSVRGDSDGPRFSRPNRAGLGLALRAAGTGRRRGQPTEYDHA